MTRWGSLVIAVLVATSEVAGAQTPPAVSAGQQTQPQAERGQRAGPAAPASATVTPEFVQNMLDGFVLKQAQVALQLSDSQYVAFLPKMDALQKLRRQHQRAYNQLVNQLNKAAPPPRAGGASSMADEPTIAAQVKAVDDLEAQMVADERAALANVDSVLTVYQRARFRVFEFNMEKEKLRLLAKAMADQNGGLAPTPPAPPVPAPNAAGSL